MPDPSDSAALDSRRWIASVTPATLALWAAIGRLPRAAPCASGLDLLLRPHFKCQELMPDPSNEALGMRFPSEIYRDSEKKNEGTPEKLLYPGIESRRVKSDGTMRFEGKVYFLSRALAGWDVGLAPVEEVRWEVRFGRLVLGHLEAATEAFLPIKTPSSQEVPKAA